MCRAFSQPSQPAASKDQLPSRRGALVAIDTAWWDLIAKARRVGTVHAVMIRKVAIFCQWDDPFWK